MVQFKFPNKELEENLEMDDELTVSSLNRYS